MVVVIRQGVETKQAMIMVQRIVVIQGQEVFRLVIRPTIIQVEVILVEPTILVVVMLELVQLHNLTPIKEQILTQIQIPTQGQVLILIQAQTPEQTQVQTQILARLPTSIIRIQIHQLATLTQTSKINYQSLSLLIDEALAKNYSAEMITTQF
jgi:hypothetical protein